VIAMMASAAGRRRFGAGVTALGVTAALLAAPAATADTEEPADPPAPTVLVADSAATPEGPEASTEIGPAAADALSPEVGTTDGDALAAAAQEILPEDGVAHLPSPDSPPPGTSAEEPTDGGRVGYLRDLWHAVRTQDYTMTDALLLFTQRSLDAKAPPGVQTTPRGQLGPSAAPPMAEPGSEPTVPLSDPAVTGPAAVDPATAEAPQVPEIPSGEIPGAEGSDAP